MIIFPSVIRYIKLHHCDILTLYTYSHSLYIYKQVLVLKVERRKYKMLMYNILRYLQSNGKNVYQCKCKMASQRVKTMNSCKVSIDRVFNNILLM